MMSVLLWMFRSLKQLTSYLSNCFVLLILSVFFLVPIPVGTMFTLMVLYGEWVGNPAFLQGWFQGAGESAAFGFCIFTAWCFFYFFLWCGHAAGELESDECYFGPCSLSSFLWGLGGSVAFVALVWVTGLGDYMVVVFGSAFSLGTFREYVFVSIMLSISVAGLLIFLYSVWYLLSSSEPSQFRLAAKDQYNGKGMVLFIILCLALLWILFLLAGLLLL